MLTIEQLSVALRKECSAVVLCFTYVIIKKTFFSQFFPLSNLTQIPPSGIVKSDQSFHKKHAKILWKNRVGPKIRSDLNSACLKTPMTTFCWTWLIYLNFQKKISLYSKLSSPFQDKKKKTWEQEMIRTTCSLRCNTSI